MTERLANVKRVKVGRTYMVPSIEAVDDLVSLNGYEWKWPFDNIKFIPISGVPHSDSQYGFGDDFHVHFEFRFLQNEVYDHLIAWTSDSSDPHYCRLPVSVLRYVLDVRWHKEEHGVKVTERPFKCLRPPIRYPLRQCGFMAHVLQEPFEGTAINPASPICPHRKAILNGLARDGCIRCPNHGLTWSASTGRMVKPRIPKYARG